jgi:hypothetical protein
MQVARLSVFEKDCKRLKRFISLQRDIETFLGIAKVYPGGTGSKHWNCLYKNEHYAVYKVRLACVSLKGETKMRVVYAYHTAHTRVDLIELYWKGEKENRDYGRVEDYVKTWLN